MSHVQDPNKCDCSCHTLHDVVHFMPCCFTCHRCGESAILDMRDHACPKDKCSGCYLGCRQCRPNG